jgi:hypothetical protein
MLDLHLQDLLLLLLVVVVVVPCLPGRMVGCWCLQVLLMLLLLLLLSSWGVPCQGSSSRAARADSKAKEM